MSGYGCRDQASRAREDPGGASRLDTVESCHWRTGLNVLLLKFITLQVPKRHRPSQKPEIPVEPYIPMER